jgi:predicted RNA-binding protein YlxR (DUF448 family)
MAPKSETAERTCLVTRRTQPPEGLLRFVRAPDGTVVPDVRGKLPGRGVWVTSRRDTVAEAVRKRLFARGFKEDATAADDLPDLVDRLLLESALASLSMARKAGRVVTGFGKVTSALAKGQAIAVLHAVEAAPDGRRKIAQVMRRRARAESDADDVAVDWDDDDDDDEVPPAGAAPEGPQTAAPAAPAEDVALPHVVSGLFSAAELDLALGGSNVIHAALLAGGASTSFLRNAAALARYRGGMPETDWTAGLGHETATR